MSLQPGIKDTVGTAGFVAAPAANVAIATIAAPGAGTYRIEMVTYQTGTPDALSKNMELRLGARVMQSLLATAVSSHARVLRVRVENGEAITVNATAIGTGQYNASIQLTQVS